MKRFRVGVRMGGNGFTLKVTDGGSRRIRNECAKHEHAHYEFDYETQEAVIFVADIRVPLDVYAKENNFPE